MRFPTLIYISRGLFYEYKGKVGNVKNLTDFAMGDYLNETGEPLLAEADRWGYFWKSTMKTYEHIYQVALLNPEYAVGLIAFFVLTFGVMIWIFLDLTKGITETKTALKNEVDEKKNKNETKHRKRD